MSLYEEVMERLGLKFTANGSGAAHASDIADVDLIVRELCTEIEELKKNAHPPFDFTSLIERVESLEHRAASAESKAYSEALNEVERKYLKME